MKIDAELFVGEFIIQDDSTITLRAFSHFCPRLNLTIPAPFQEYFGRNFSVGWVDRMSKLLHNKDPSSGKDNRCFRQTDYEPIVKNIDKNKKLETYKEVIKDVYKWLEKSKGKPMAKL